MSRSWFIMRGESRLGPFTHHGLVHLAANGELSAADLVWCADMKAPLQATGVAGLFPEPDPPAQPVLQAAAEPALVAPPAPALVAPPAPAFVAPPVPAGLAPPRRSPPAPAGVAPPAPAGSPFVGLVAHPFAPPLADQFDDTIDEDIEPEDTDQDDDAEADVPMVGRSTRRIRLPRRQNATANVPIVLGGLALVAVVMLAIVLGQQSGQPARVVQAPRVVTKAPLTQPVSTPSTPRTAPPAQPKRPAQPPPPRFDSQPLLEEMARSTVKDVLESLPSVPPRFRQLWEGQLLTQLTVVTRGMRGEVEIRAAVQRSCESWAVETRKFVTAETESKREAEAESSAASDATQVSGDEPSGEPADGEGMKPDQSEPVEPT